MYTYSIYHLTEEVAMYYFHKSSILYRFLREFESLPYRADLRRQFEYITDRIRYDQILLSIQRHESTNLFVNIDKDKVSLYNRKAFISLHISEKQLKFHCKTLESAEELLFPILRSYHPLLFVVGDNIKNFGWITPLLEYSRLEQNEVLYS
ncbi:sporulation inhibitor of replication protein SirA [Virgibacillus pantothenticus]|uniref:sporulation inhibitor of replication protein SirA n=1 Tax=Virgibacillus pantothenticus TaxID=1473 RepID=UPI003D2C2DEF